MTVTCKKYPSRVKHCKTLLQAQSYIVLTGHIAPLIVMGKVSATQTVIHQTLILIHDARTHHLNQRGSGVMNRQMDYVLKSYLVNTL